MTLVGHREPVESVAFSPDGGTIATASDDATTQIWDASSGQHRLTLYGHVSHVASVVFDSAGTRLLTGSEDGYAKVWGVATGRDLLTLAGHSSGVLAAAWSPDLDRAGHPQQIIPAPQDEVFIQGAREQSLDVGA